MKGEAELARLIDENIHLAKIRAPNGTAAVIIDGAAAAAKAIIAAGWSVVPQSSVVVPREPTGAMVKAGKDELLYDAADDYVLGVWRAMCIAAKEG